MTNLSPQSGNLLLNHLPRVAFKRLKPHLQPFALEKPASILKTKDVIEYVYFPVSGIVSSMRIMEDGTAIEVATIGKEGMVGLSAFMDESHAPFDLMVQISGDAWRMRADALRKAVDEEAALKRILVRYQTAFMIQVCSAVACNGLHTIVKRCCRWLLMTQDRVQSDRLPLTHELLAIMLGVRRASVTEVLRPLQSNGTIRNERGFIEVLDRNKLEQQSCECYRHVTQEFARLFD